MVKSFEKSIIILFIVLSSHSFSQQPDFRQTVNISITASLNDSNRSLSAHQNIQYINNSPDTLQQIIMHLWANAWKINTTSFAKQLIQSRNYDFHFAREHQRGGYRYIDFKTDGSSLSWGNWQENEDVMVLYLPKILPPGDTLLITASFELIFPDAQFSRLGHHNGSFYATQWYPKPAVYNSDGWHPMPYLHRGEFFSEFGSFNLLLTMPENYIVASTGNLVTESEKMFLNNIARQTRILGPEIPDAATLPPASSPKTKTIQFFQENVHDFAWFADKQFKVLIDSVKTGGGKNVTAWSFFTHDAPQWFRANRYLISAVNYMSNVVGPYPWQHITAVQGIYSGGANMEYPAIALIGKKESDSELERVIVHEAIHNWFYGILASNERMEPWIDEGFTTYYENRYFDEKYPKQKLLGPLSTTLLAGYFELDKINFNQEAYFYYLLKAAQHLDQPAGSASCDLTEVNYYAMVYFKAAMAIRILEASVGRQRFDTIMKGFYQKWKFRHPATRDIRKHFFEHTSDSLNWFFDGYIASSHKTDLAIRKAKRLTDHYQVDINNSGNVNTPFQISGIKNNQEVITRWYGGFDGSVSLEFPAADYDHIVIDYQGLIPEINRSNNSIRTHGFLPRLKIPELLFLGSIKDPKQPRLYWAPVAHYNPNDGLMPGLAFYSYVFPYSVTNLFLMPMYSSRRDRLAGTAWFYRDFYPGTPIIHSLRPGIKVKSYGLGHGKFPREFKLIEYSFQMTFNAPLSSNRTHTYIKYLGTDVKRDVVRFSGGQPRVETSRYFINQLVFNHENRSVFNPWGLNAELLQGNEIVRASLTFSQFFPYAPKNKGFGIRMFAGKFFVSPSDAAAPDFRFGLQGSTPMRLPLFNQMFAGHGQPAGIIWGNQMAGDMGNFKYPTPLGLTWNWLVATNITADIPILPLRLFFDTGTYHGASIQIPDTEKYPWVAGAQISIIRDVVKVNLPIATSNDLKRIAGLNGLDSWLKKITFSIDLLRISPMEARRNLHLWLF